MIVFKEKPLTVLEIYQIASTIIFIIFFVGVIKVHAMSKHEFYEYHALIKKPVDMYTAELPDFGIVCGHFDTKADAIESSKNHLEIIIWGMLQDGIQLPYPMKKTSSDYHLIRTNMTRLRKELRGE